MQRNTPVILLVLIVLGTLISAFAQQATGPTQQIENQRQQWQERYNQGNTAGVAELYTEDATLYDGTGQVAQGRQAIQENLQATYDQGLTQVEINSTETQVFGDAAYDLGRFTYRTADGQTAAQGNYLAVLQRINGDWRIYRHIANLQLPQQQGTPAAGTTYQFSKEDPDGDNIWDGTLTGDTQGTVQTVLLNADQSEPVWRVAFEGIVTADEQSFRAHVGGTLDTTTGAVRMNGVVTAGSMLGATVDWQGQMVDQQASRFEGTITVTPAAGNQGTGGAQTGTSEQGTMESTRSVVEQFVSEHDASMLAEDAVFTILASGEQHQGRDAIAGMLDFFYQQAFDAHLERTNLVIGENQAVVEGMFVGKHIGEFAGIPATNKDVRVPVAVVYELENGQIVRARVYLQLAVLLGQLQP